VEQTAAVALGSNLGSRAANLARARARIADCMGHLVASSRIYETDPVGPPQACYLNQVLVLDAADEPEELIARAQRIESELGRARRQRWGPRTIDVDLLLHGDRVRAVASLTLPHPRLHERAFVLVPLAEVLPDWRHPILGRTVREMRAACAAAGVRPWEEGTQDHGG
jgi:2-amino-4-hydroxy-6-hydroxymethyldihydropteridine diphosphokinase